MKAMKEECQNKQQGVVICCGGQWRQLFDMVDDHKNGHFNSKGYKPDWWTIDTHINDIVTIGPYITWGHLDAVTSRISFLPLGTKAMKIWIYARTT